MGIEGQGCCRFLKAAPITAERRRKRGKRRDSEIFLLLLSLRWMKALNKGPKEKKSSNMKGLPRYLFYSLLL